MVIDTFVGYRKAQNPAGQSPELKDLPVIENLEFRLQLIFRHPLQLDSKHYGQNDDPRSLGQHLSKGLN